MEVAWQAHFVINMFIRPTKAELEIFGKPDFIVMNGSKTSNSKWKEHGLNSEVFTVFNLTEQMQVIGGSWYGGEMKKRYVFDDELFSTVKRNGIHALFRQYG